MDKLTQNKKYQDIIKTGKELFWKYGLKRVTIEEICKESGVSKMTFYKFFPNKKELAKLILDKIYEDAFQKFEKLVNSNISFPKKLEQMFVMKLEGMKNVSMEFIKDIYMDPESGLMTHMEAHRQKSMEVIINFYKTAQDKGSIRKDVKIEFIMAFSNQIIKMMEDEKLMSLYKQPQDFIMESMNFLFYGIVTRNE
ncbi:MAG: TetR/AcrR family transcriptional regulator [Cyclobacteriaceae bacterium]|nr:TetR/AcrR family transcriptional regulator [Cyclobacteriaceae bacterium]MCK5367519.1 TetR/AcrR family transcriptional regulator [Cyclobacteriaceae bacterium]MCK5467629.1 TetR/AcrR family transcriptional regulator [Cyclobacteriaceae bacterium]MCK5702646.1 TetR/AcrR family transcriptional regulator [Cyclobacteriaceae bacterium]